MLIRRAEGKKFCCYRVQSCLSYRISILLSLNIIDTIYNNLYSVNSDLKYFLFLKFVLLNGKNIKNLQNSLNCRDHASFVCNIFSRNIKGCAMPRGSSDNIQSYCHIYSCTAGNGFYRD